MVVVAECGGDDRGGQVEDVLTDRGGAAGGGWDADLVDQRGQCVGPEWLSGAASGEQPA
ncbi:hypothetical protein [Actinoplanes sp. CA-252034]|uniref:hypothetical protein n=1 Tax=Actinoplanes sp. CA-252034 TaxID=3239906 RepID=UPI003D99152F